MNDTDPRTETKPLGNPQGPPEDNYVAAIELALKDLQCHQAVRGLA